MANAKYKIHFTDDYGTGTLEADTLEDRNEIIANLNSDMEHPAWDIWTETYNTEEGYYEA